MSFLTEQLATPYTIDGLGSNSVYCLRFFTIPYADSTGENTSEYHTFFLRIRPIIYAQAPWYWASLPVEDTETYIYIHDQDVTSQVQLDGLFDSQIAVYGAVGSYR